MRKLTKEDIINLYERKLELQQEIDEIDEQILDAIINSCYEPIVFKTIFLS